VAEGDVVGCIACDLTAGRRELPGGRLYETSHWIVEHCVGPLGLGALIVKPVRHVVTVGALDDAEVAELGAVLRQSAGVVDALLAPEQVYVGLWSHAGRRRGHIHFVVQPATTELIDEIGDYGPHLQAGLFDRGDVPDAAEVDAFCVRARAAFADPADA
jgi:diadenosine tetraphosphate (Ap4A) HIT family hydrolase